MTNSHNHIGNIYEIPTPFVVYVGDYSSIQRKVAKGLHEWAPEKVCAYVGEPDSNITDTFKNLSDVPTSLGKTLVIGIAPFGGQLDSTLIKLAVEACTRGYDVAAGLHEKLSDCPEIVEAAIANNVKLYDFRHRVENYPTGTGAKREGIRLLTVGTDCSCGKKFTTLTLFKIAQQLASNNKNLPTPKFCSTGQTGFLISNSGINNDTLTADFLAGAAEYLSPSDKNAFYFIEGQGALRHPAYCGGSFSLLAGSQPDFIVMCHTVGRGHMSGTEVKVDLGQELAALNSAIEIFNLHSKVVAISLNFSEVPRWTETLRVSLIRATEMRCKVKVFAPGRQDSVEIMHHLVEDLFNADRN